MCAYHTCVPDASGGQEGVGSFGAGVTEAHVGTGTQTWVFCKSSKCSEMLSHLSSPPPSFPFRDSFLNAGDIDQ